MLNSVWSKRRRGYARETPPRPSRACRSAARPHLFAGATLLRLRLILGTPAAPSTSLCCRAGSGIRVVFYAITVTPTHDIHVYSFDPPNKFECPLFVSTLGLASRWVTVVSESPTCPLASAPPGPHPRPGHVRPAGIPSARGIQNNLNPFHVGDGYVPAQCRAGS